MTSQPSTHSLSSADSLSGEDQIHAVADLARRLAKSLAQVMNGKADAIETIVTTLLAGGHVLLEDVPGVGKTTLASTLARSLDATMRRVQFTADMLPTDVTGLSIYDQDAHTFEFHPGPIFTNIAICDEVNRATPRTQSALLEAMGEKAVTVDGHTYRLPELFIVVATQNPHDMEGTFPLPEAQRDRSVPGLVPGFVPGSVPGFVPGSVPGFVGSVPGSSPLTLIFHTLLPAAFLSTT